MVPQLQFQAGAALVFGELHDSILMDRVRGISYHTGYGPAPSPRLPVSHYPEPGYCSTHYRQYRRCGTGRQDGTVCVDRDVQHPRFII